MAIILKYKVSTTIGIVILMTITIFCIVTITDRAFSNSFSTIEAAQISQLDLIKRATGDDMDINNIANWNVYTNTKYGFNVRYPETLEQSEDESKKTYTEDHPESPMQPLKISFENFSIKVWDNSNDIELKKYLALKDFCTLEGVFCRNYKKMDEVALVMTDISGKQWFKTENKLQRFFIPILDNKYFLDFELINQKQDKEFNKVISTLGFIR